MMRFYTLQVLDPDGLGRAPLFWGAVYTWFDLPAEPWMAELAGGVMAVRANRRTCDNRREDRSFHRIMAGSETPEVAGVFGGALNRDSRW